MEITAAAKVMIYLRFLLAIISLVAVYLMIKFPTVEAGLRINAVLAISNPAILLLINLVGVSGMANKMDPSKLIFVLLGAIFIMLGTSK